MKALGAAPDDEYQDEYLGLACVIGSARRLCQFLTYSWILQVFTDLPGHGTGGLQKACEHAETECLGGMLRARPCV